MVRAYIGSNCLSFQMICLLGFVLLHFALGYVDQEGDNVTLSCDSSDVEYPPWKGPPNYVWYNSVRDSRISDDIGEKSNRLSWDPANNKSLIVHNLTKNDSGLYMCFSEDEIPIKEYIINFIDFALGVVVQEGDNVTLSCDSSDVEYPIWKGPPNHVWYNFHGNSRIQDNIGEKSNRLRWDPANNKSLIVHNVTKKDSGLYMCFDEYYNTVGGYDVYVNDFALGVVVQEGDNVTLSCDSSDVEYPQWRSPPNFVYNSLRDSRINDDIGEKSNRLSWDPANNKSLIVHNVTKIDSGLYFCFEENKSFKGHRVYVIDFALGVVVQEGDNVILFCDSSTIEYPQWRGPPNLVYNSFRDFRINDDIGEKSNRLSWDLANNKNLIVYNVTKSDSGLYLCLDEYNGIVGHRVYVIVRPEKPEISNKEIQDDGTEVIRGTMEQLFTLTCTSTGGFPKPNLEWFRDNNQTQRLTFNETYEIDADGNYIVEQTHTFTPTRTDDGALYLCQSSFDSPQQFYQTDEVKLFLNQAIQTEQTSNLALLLRVIVGVVAVIVCTIIVVCVVVWKRRSTEYTRRNTSLHRDTIQSPETANPSSDIEMEPLDGGHFNIEPSVYEELEERKGNAHEYGTSLTEYTRRNTSLHRNVYEELEERKENVHEYGTLMTGSDEIISNDNVYEHLEIME